MADAMLAHCRDDILLSQLPDKHQIKKEYNPMDHGMKAAELFLSGYNCAQAVAVAFCDVTEMDEKTTARMVSAFGGGMGRLREVCGAVSGMLMVAGLLYGYKTPGDDVSKKAHYTLVQELSAQFRAEAGSIVCREILKNPPSDPNPSPRTAEYYAKRPCCKMVMTAAKLLDEFIAEHPLEK
jgi:C_GCAxxG_C_C family probable redox protein